jgi:hypothetical protein
MCNNRIVSHTSIAVILTHSDILRAKMERYGTHRCITSIRRTFADYTGHGTYQDFIDSLMAKLQQIYRSSTTGTARPAVTVATIATATASPATPPVDTKTITSTSTS